MSLISLPDELVAHISSFLNYEDTCNLMMSCKKNYNAIKAYKKDKIKLEYVQISINGSSVIAKEEGEKTEKHYRLKSSFETDNRYESIKTVLNMCQSVRNVTLFNGTNDGKLDSELVKILSESKAKLSHVVLIGGLIDLSCEEFIAFCRKFNGSSFNYCKFNFAIWNDEVLVHVFPHTYLSRQEAIDLPVHSEEVLTDKTLEALVSQNEMMRGCILGGIYNSFTVEQVVRNLEITRNRPVLPLFWELGILPADQVLDAERYFNEENGELKEHYEITKLHLWNDGVVKYELIDKRVADPDPSFCVHFLVAM